VYSLAVIREQHARLVRALRGVPHRVHYSMKANSNAAIIGYLRHLGVGVDIVSGGELYRALRAGVRGSDVVFSGAGKTAGELREAIAADIRLINVESEGELRLLDQLGAEAGRVIRMALRVNPEVTVDTPHPYTRTGEAGAKFGIPYNDALAVAGVALDLPNVCLAGLAMHLGSQISTVDPWRTGTERLLALCSRLRARGASELEYLDIGGGLAVAYEEEVTAGVEQLAEAVVPLVRDVGLTLVVEPGRYLVGNAGVLLTRVLYRKRSGGREYVIADAGMNDLLRPSHYRAHHAVVPVEARSERGVFDVVGPVCESGDFLALDREMEAVGVGDLLAIGSAGAYGFCMASNYNSRRRAAEVVVEGERFAVAAHRETYADLVRQEPMTPTWMEHI
jgi:diaminopimelate decarboxylase